MEIILLESFSRSTKTICSMVTAYPPKPKAVYGGVQMMIKYFKDIDILNIELHEGEFGYSEEIAEGVIFDISQEGEILSIEVLDVAKKFRKPGCGAGFREACGKSAPDDDLNRVWGFALQLAASRPASVCAASDAAEDAKDGA